MLSHKYIHNQIQSKHYGRIEFTVFTFQRGKLFARDLLHAFLVGNYRFAECKMKAQRKQQQKPFPHNSNKT